MRPKKTILIQHFDEDERGIMRYALAIATNTRPVLICENPDLTVAWCHRRVTISSDGDGIYRVLPLSICTAELVEAIRMAMARKRGPKKMVVA